MSNNYVYEVEDSIYINLTNRCTNKCEFCVRYYDEFVYGDLWINHEPSAEEVIEILKQYDLSKYKEVVFCGYGEPTYRIDAIVKIAEYVHSLGYKTRINTNGHGNAINNRDITTELVKAIDTIGISLNATDATKYNAICHSIYKEKAFDIMLDFAKKCIEKGGKVKLSVVDSIGNEEIEKAQKIADSIGAILRVRKLI